MKQLFLLCLITLCSNTLSASNLSPNVGDSLASETLQSFDPYAATDVYLNTLTDEQKAKSDAYFEGGYWLLLWGVLYSLAVAWVFLSKGLSLKLKELAQKISKKTNLTNLIYIAFYMISGYVLSFPLTLYEEYFREHQYDLSNLTFGAWMTEELQGLLISTLLMALLFMVLYIAIRRVGKTWWIWGAGITFFFMVIMILIGPIFISPIFNDYKFLEDGPIKESILSMARANDVPVENVYQFDASKQSTRISANVSGIANTIRISLNDNLLNRCNEAEIKAVMGHELGHYILNHIYKMLVAFGLVTLVGFAFVNWGYQFVLKKWGANWGINDLQDVAGLPLVMVLFSVFFFLAKPVTNNIIRINEVEADNYGLNAAREPDGFASTAMKLSEYRKIDPGYWEEIIFFDHPSGKNRVLMAMKWKAENLDTNSEK